MLFALKDGKNIYTLLRWHGLLYRFDVTNSTIVKGEISITSSAISYTLEVQGEAFEHFVS